VVKRSKQLAALLKVRGALRSVIAAVTAAASETFGQDVQRPTLHNFVLAHSRCNNAKSDFLAAEQHLSCWAERNHVHASELKERMQDAGLPNDFTASTRIAEWAYEQVEQANGQVWLNDAVFQHLGAGWRELLAV
jgi:hypothetical protein